MFFTKVLSNSQRIFSGKVPAIKTVGTVARQRHTKAIPSPEPLTTGQTITVGILLTVSMWAIPFWVTYYIPEYQGEDRNVYTGK